MIISSFKKYKIDRKSGLPLLNIAHTNVDDSIDTCMLLISDIRGAYCFAPKSLGYKRSVMPDNNDGDPCFVLDSRLFCTNCL